jgi:hypothetical protein
MSTTSSINAGLANLLQNLTNIGSPLASSPTIVAALQKASPGDIVQLSAEATQLEGVNALFGVPDPSSAGSSTTDSLFSSLYGGNSSSTDPLLASLDPTLADSSTSSSNSALAPLLQDLSNLGLSSQVDTAALQNASPTDIVQLSTEATQLAGLNLLYGQPDTTGTLRSPQSLLSGLY